MLRMLLLLLRVWRQGELLLEQRHGAPAPAGLLVYLAAEDSALVPARSAEVAAILQGRNRLAADLAAPPGRLPRLARDPGMCRSCYRLGACALYHRALDGGDAESFGLGGGGLAA